MSDMLETEWWADDLSWRVRLLRRKAGWAFEVSHYYEDGMRWLRAEGGTRPTIEAAKEAAFLALARDLPDGGG